MGGAFAVRSRILRGSCTGQPRFVVFRSRFMYRPSTGRHLQPEEEDDDTDPPSTRYRRNPVASRVVSEADSLSHLSSDPKNEQAGFARGPRRWTQSALASTLAPRTGT